MTSSFDEKKIINLSINIYNIKIILAKLQNFRKLKMSEIQKLYKGLFLKHGDSPYAIKARDKKQQYKRFINLIRCCDFKKGDIQNLINNEYK